MAKSVAPVVAPHASTTTTATIAPTETKSLNLKSNTNRRPNDVPTSFKVWKQTPPPASPPSTAVPPVLSASSTAVRLVTAAEYKEAALCLAEAFAEDDVARYFIDVPDREHWSTADKWALHVEILEYVTYAHILKGLVTTVGEFEAVALWMPPGQNMDDWLTILRSGMWRLNYRLSTEGKRRFFTEFLPLLHDTMHATLGDREHDAWYLVYLGTRSSARGKGHARTLVEHVTVQADREGRPVYLESSNAANPPIYRKFGFVEKRTVHLQRAEADVPLDIMVREPVGGQREKEMGVGMGMGIGN